MSDDPDGDRLPEEIIDEGPSFDALRMECESYAGEYERFDPFRKKLWIWISHLGPLFVGTAALLAMFAYCGYIGDYPETGIAKPLFALACSCLIPNFVYVLVATRKLGLFAKLIALAIYWAFLNSFVLSFVVVIAIMVLSLAYMAIILALRALGVMG